MPEENENIIVSSREEDSDGILQAEEARWYTENFNEAQIEELRLAIDEQIRTEAKKGEYQLDNITVLNANLLNAIVQHYLEQGYNVTIQDAVNNIISINWEEYSSEPTPEPEPEIEPAVTDLIISPQSDLYYREDSDFEERDWLVSITYESDTSVRIYYTTDGTIPDPENTDAAPTLYEGQPFDISSLISEEGDVDITINVAAVADNRQTVNTSETYYIRQERPTLIPPIAPKIWPKSGTYDTEVLPISIVTEESANIIYYTTDGTTPDPENSAHLYDGILSITEDTTVKAIAYSAETDLQSEETVAQYSISEISEQNSSNSEDNQELEQGE